MGVMLLLSILKKYVYLDDKYPKSLKNDRIGIFKGISSWRFAATVPVVISVPE